MLTKRILSSSLRCVYSRDQSRRQRNNYCRDVRGLIGIWKRYRSRRPDKSWHKGNITRCKGSSEARKNDGLSLKISRLSAREVGEAARDSTSDGPASFSLYFSQEDVFSSIILHRTSSPFPPYFSPAPATFLSHYPSLSLIFSLSRRFYYTFNSCFSVLCFLRHFFLDSLIHYLTSNFFSGLMNFSRYFLGVFCLVRVYFNNLTYFYRRNF